MTLNLRTALLLASAVSAALWPRSAHAEKIQTVYLCGATVEILLSTTQRWLFVDTTDGLTTDKMVDRIYAMALSTWLGNRDVTFFSPSNQVSSLPCIAGPVAAFRINVLQVQ